MKRILTLLLVLALCVPSFGQAGQTGSQAQKQTSTQTQPPSSAPAPKCPSANYYVNSAGKCVHRPVQSQTAPAGATAQCRDGTYSFSQSRRGTCSHHGGVSKWLTH
jgi:hypothetical protein